MDLRTLKKGETDPRLSRIYFDVKLAGTNGISPALNEVGGQPELSLNGSSWNSSGIGVLIDIGHGSYYTNFDANFLANDVIAGDIIETRYQGILTDQSRGDSFQIINDSIITPIPVTPAEALLAYVTLPEANFYFSNRLFSDLWFDQDNNTKLVALRDSTRRIDRLNFAGDKLDDTQLLQFPRKMTPVVTVSGFGFSFALPDQDEPTDIITGVDIGEEETSLIIDVDVPADIKAACCEIAIALLDGRDPDLDIEQLIVDSQSYSGVRTSYTRKIALEHVRAGIPSALAWSYLKPYLRDFRNLYVSRAN